MNTPTKIPTITFKTHTNDQNVCGADPFAWVDVTTDELFSNKKVVLFSIPGAFTPTCSSAHLPGYEAKFEELKNLGIDTVICISVNDVFVMNQWGTEQKVNNVTLIPYGSGEFTKAMGMLVKKDNLGFGERSWRYSMFVDNRDIKKVFEEPGKSDNCTTDPFEVSDVDTMLEYLRSL